MPLCHHCNAAHQIFFLDLAVDSLNCWETLFLGRCVKTGVLERVNEAPTAAIGLLFERPPLLLLFSRPVIIVDQVYNIV